MAVRSHSSTLPKWIREGHVAPVSIWCLQSPRTANPSGSCGQISRQVTESNHRTSRPLLLTTRSGRFRKCVEPCRTTPSTHSVSTSSLPECKEAFLGRLARQNAEAHRGCRSNRNCGRGQCATGDTCGSRARNPALASLVGRQCDANSANRLDPLARVSIRLPLLDGSDSRRVIGQHNNLKSQEVTDGDAAG